MIFPPREFPWETGPWCLSCEVEMEHTERNVRECTDIFTCPKCRHKILIAWD